MKFLLLCFVVLTISTTTNTLNVWEHADSCFSNVQIKVPYTLWVGTNVTKDFTLRLTVPQYTAFYEVMKRAESQSSQHYSFQTTCSQYGHYVTSIGGIRENVTAGDYWLIYILLQAPNIHNPPSSGNMSLGGVDSLRVMDGKHYLFWFRNIDGIGR